MKFSAKRRILRLNNPVNLLTLKLESQMFEKLIETAKTSDSLSGVSFADVFDSALNSFLGGDSNDVCSVSDDEPQDVGNMKVSDRMVKFIEEHEGFSATAYRGVDSWNRTIGYGHVEADGENIAPLTQSEAEQLLRNDLKEYEASVNKEFKGVKLTQSQFDALTSFAYNLGANIWSKTPKLVSDIKSGAPADVIKADMENCAHVGGKLVRGLVNRRNDEWEVFANGNYSA